MTILEQALATILESIESARASANTQALAALLARKEAICAALAAPEQWWHDPHAHASDTFVQPKAQES